MAKNKTWIEIAVTALIVGVVLFFWTRGGFNSVYLDTDLGRDLSQLSNLWIGQKIIWLGPRLSPGLSASPIYYYLFYPALVIGMGDANSLIVFNLIIAASSISLFGFLAIRKWKLVGALSTLALGLMPLFMQTSMHPGNGITYLFLLLISITFLWFEFPIWASALFLGFAISFHPAAIFGLPFLIYEIIKRKGSVKKILIAALLLILPWTPIIVFEIITKGFLTREFLAQKSAGLVLQFNLTNIQNLFAFTGINYIIALASLITLTYFSKNRIRIWLVISLILLAPFFFVPTLPTHYFFGLTGIIVIIFLTGLMESAGKKYISKIIIALMIVNSLLIFKTPPPAARNIEKIQSVVNSYMLNSKINKNDKIAVIAALGPEASSPQADDYRFFLRIKGYNVLDIPDYSKANILIEFIEYPGFDWKHWSTFETQQFGNRKLQDELKIQGVEVITYSK